MSEGRFGTNADVHGILLLDKPLTLTSAAAVARLKRLFCARKTGHTGSLDPLATGFLAICFGEATKFGAHLLDADKTYRVTVRLGERTPSGDQETAVCERQSLPALLSADNLRSALAGFPSEYEQMPPMHSALKQGGKPLYSYARAGITLDRVPRKVAIYGMQMLSWNSPDMCFDVHCSKGTYIRVLAEDIAARLSTIGHLIGLRRLSVAPWRRSNPWFPPKDGSICYPWMRRCATYHGWIWTPRRPPSCGWDARSMCAPTACRTCGFTVRTRNFWGWARCRRPAA
jgi:tRNA pseudouridine55 synthase